MKIVNTLYLLFILFTSPSVVLTTLGRKERLRVGKGRGSGGRPGKTSKKSRRTRSRTGCQGRTSRRSLSSIDEYGGNESGKYSRGNEGPTFTLTRGVDCSWVSRNDTWKRYLERYLEEVDYPEEVQRVQRGLRHRDRGRLRRARRGLDSDVKCQYTSVRSRRDD